MANDKEITVEEKLRALYDLQLVDSRIDKIRSVRGELPLEVEDLEDEITGLETRLEKLGTDITGLENDIKEKKVGIEEADKLSIKYEEQQKNVRNNREYDSLSKEMEFQSLEKELSEKRIGEYQAKIIQKKQTIEETNTKLDTRKGHLQHKKDELDGILAETQREEEFLLAKSEEFGLLIEERLIFAYKRIRKNVRNGLAVVSIERGASGGSFFTIPPQRQLEIATRKKVIIDEHSGRILVDPALANEEREKMEAMFTSID
ncbi:MAG: C4-type zinc ribbon domain-containing protein [Bacteroidota bacterium]